MATKALKLEKKQEPKEVRIPIKEQTARNLIALNDNITSAAQATKIAQQRLADAATSLMTEHGINGNGKLLNVTDTEPYELVLEVTK